jgi:integrase
MPTGRVVFYFQCYDENGVRQNGRSTGCSKKTEAMAYCMRLYRDGVLVPRKKTMTFADFAEGWWDIKTCKYLQFRQLSNPLSENTIDLNRGNTRNYLKEFYGPFPLGDITKDTVKEWVQYMNGRGLAVSTINSSLKTLRVMLEEAIDRGMISSNAAKEVKELKAAEAGRVILTREEMDKLFPAKWKTVWSDRVIYMAHRLASCTGMRIAELRGLKGDKVFSDYIHVCGQYNSRHGYKEQTKTKHDRNIPIAKEVYQELEPLLKANGKGYVFSDDGGIKPVTSERIGRAFEKALEGIGIGHEERLGRNLTFHAWRHFFNTALRMENVTDAKVQSVTGHLTQKETDHYTHFDTRQFTEIREVQTKLLTGKTEKTGGKKQRAANSGKGRLDEKAGKKRTTVQATA